MNGRTIIGGAAMAAAITGGALVGAVAGVPFASGAQEATEAPATEANEEAREHGPRGPGMGLRGMKLDAAAEVIGITEDELREQLKSGATLAEVAEANGVDRQAVVDALVAAGNAQLDELRASLPERMDELVDRSIPADREGWRDRMQEHRAERRGD